MDVQGAPRDVGAVGVQGEQHRPFAQWRSDDPGLEGGLPRQGEFHVPLASLGAGVQRPGHQEVDLVAGSDDVAKTRAGQETQPLAEQGLRRLIGRLQRAVRADDQRRIGARLERGGLEPFGCRHEVCLIFAHTDRLLFRQFGLACPERTLDKARRLAETGACASQPSSPPQEWDAARAATGPSNGVCSPANRCSAGRPRGWPRQGPSGWWWPSPRARKRPPPRPWPASTSCSSCAGARNGRTR